MTHSIDVKELTRRVSIGDPVTLLDVRRRTDYEAAPEGIAGASWRDPERIEAWVNQLPAADLTVVYCVKGGSVSQSVANRLRQEGLETVFLEGGLSAEEAVELSLPVKDYCLRSTEERIIIYADRLVDIITDGIVPIREEKRPKYVSRRS